MGTDTTELGARVPQALVAIAPPSTTFEVARTRAGSDPFLPGYKRFYTTLLHTWTPRNQSCGGRVKQA